jgi:hypothetical protein
MKMILTEQKRRKSYQQQKIMRFAQWEVIKWIAGQLWKGWSRRVKEKTFNFTSYKGFESLIKGEVYEYWQLYWIQTGMWDVQDSGLGNLI